MNNEVLISDLDSIARVLRTTNPSMYSVVDLRRRISAAECLIAKLRDILVDERNAK